MATKNRQVLYEYVETQNQVVSRDSSLNDLSRKAADRRQHEEWLGHLFGVLSRFRCLENSASHNLMDRASNCFLTYEGRPHSFESTADLNLRVAMACSLLDRYGEGQVTKPPANGAVS